MGKPPALGMDDTLLLVLDQPCQLAVDWVMQKICQAGMRVTRTFDLREANRSRAAGIPECEGDNEAYNLVVLLVYGEREHPLSLAVNSVPDQTWLTLFDTPHNPADQSLRRAILEALAA